MSASVAHREVAGGMPRAMQASGWYAATAQVDEAFTAQDFYGWRRDDMVAAYSDLGMLVEAVRADLFAEFSNDAFVLAAAGPLLNRDHIASELQRCGGDVTAATHSIRRDIEVVKDSAYGRRNRLLKASSSASTVSYSVTKAAPFTFRYFQGESEKAFSQADIRLIETKLLELNERIEACQDITLDMLRAQFGFDPQGDDYWQFILDDGRHADIDRDTIRFATVRDRQGELEFCWRSSPEIGPDKTLTFGQEITQRFSKASAFVKRFGSNMLEMAKELKRMTYDQVMDLMRTEEKQLIAEAEQAKEQLQGKQADIRLQPVAISESDLGELSPFSPQPGILLAHGTMRRISQPILMI